MLLRSRETSKQYDMKLFKVIFVNNTVSTCKLLDRKMKLNGEYFFDHTNGKLIYAIIKAETEAEASSKAQLIISDFT